jgi:hypothetical protein
VDERRKKKLEDVLLLLQKRDRNATLLLPKVAGT